MLVVDLALRLSATRALFGAISPKIRLVKVSSTAMLITLTAVADSELGQAKRQALSITAAEIVADFPAHKFEEWVIVDTGPLPVEDVLQPGWVYQRYVQRVVPGQPT